MASKKRKTLIGIIVAAVLVIGYGVWVYQTREERALKQIAEIVYAQCLAQAAMSYAQPGDSDICYEHYHSVVDDLPLLPPWAP